MHSQNLNLYKVETFRKLISTILLIPKSLFINHLRNNAKKLQKDFQNFDAILIIVHQEKKAFNVVEGDLDKKLFYFKKNYKLL